MPLFKKIVVVRFFWSYTLKQIINFLMSKEVHYDTVTFVCSGTVII